MENFAAFFSYVHADDEHDNGRLTWLRQTLEGEVQTITGQSFELFQDYEGIHWGQKWEERLNSALDGSTFLIVVVTPRYLNSKYCRLEFERFLEFERKLGRTDLILPILYIEARILSDDTLRAANPLAKAIAEHQYFDWRDLRYEPLTNPEICKRVEKMAREIENAMLRTAAPASKPAPKAEAASPGVSAPVTQESEPKTPKISPRTEPPTLVVDPMPRRGDHTRIMDAIQAAKPGTRILIRPGLYKEALVLEKALELLGDGERSEIVVETSGAPVLLFKTEFGRVANLTLRQSGGDDFYSVDIAQGRLELEDCDITSQSLACVAIHGGADPRLRRNCIHDGNEGGVSVYDNGKGTLEENDIFANIPSGVEISTSGDPRLRRNRIHDGKGGGVLVWGNGKGILEDNDIFANTLVGVEVKAGGDPTLLRNRIYDGKQSGVLVQENSKSTLEDNDISANAYSGLEVREGGTPVVRSNRIMKNKHNGIWVHRSGGGTFENNDLRKNGRPWRIDESSQANVRKSGNIEK
jgi:F-box protein 11